MNKYLRLAFIVFILVVISIFLFISGKRHDITLINNINSEIKYSVEGKPYKSLSANKKAKFFLKGRNGTIFIKKADAVSNITVKMDLVGNYDLFVKEALNGEEFLLPNNEVQEVVQENIAEQNQEVKNPDEMIITNN